MTNFDDREKLAEWMDKEGLTEQEAASRLQLALPTFRAIVTGLRRPSKESVAKIKGVTGLSLKAYDMTPKQPVIGRSASCEVGQTMRWTERVVTARGIPVIFSHIVTVMAIEGGKAIISIAGEHRQSVVPIRELIEEE